MGWVSMLHVWGRRQHFCLNINVRNGVILIGHVKVRYSSTSDGLLFLFTVALKCFSTLI